MFNIRIRWVAVVILGLLLPGLMAGCTVEGFLLSTAAKATYREYQKHKAEKGRQEQSASQQQQQQSGGRGQQTYAADGSGESP